MAGRRGPSSGRATGRLDGAAMNDRSPEEADGIVDADRNGPDRVVTLGRHLDVSVQVAISRRPAAATVPDEFAVNVFVPNDDGKNVDVVRIDTAHAGCHVDRFYLPEGHPRRREDYSMTFFSPEEALRFLTERNRWRRFLERYAETHGLPERASGSTDSA